MNAKDRWSLRERGLPLSQIWPRLKEVVSKNIDYSSGAALGFPGTTPIPESLRALKLLAPTQANNIGIHTMIQKAEIGFPGTQELEREFIYTVANLAGAGDPEKDIDGYICSGGTEGNDQGMWMGRNMLLTYPVLPGQGHGIAVLTSFLAHYSVQKHFGRLFQGNPENVLVELPTNPAGEVEGSILQEKIISLVRHGYNRFLVILTAGTTNLGSVDQIEESCSSLRSLANQYGISVYVHVDAAFGGFVLPFLEPETKFGFQNDLVYSISMDAHKMGFAPYPAGIFLCRKGLLKYTETKADYLGSHSDFTVSGSRSGAIAAACWTLLNVRGRRDYEEVLESCIANRDYLKKHLGALEVNGKKASFYPARLNVLTAHLPEEISAALEIKDADGFSLRERRCIPTDHFPEDLDHILSNGGIIQRPATVHRFVIMPHYKQEKIDEFIAELSKLIAPMPVP